MISSSPGPISRGEEATLMNIYEKTHQTHMEWAACDCAHKMHEFNFET